MDKLDKDRSNQLLAFTFFYAIGIYLLLLGFYFWHMHIEDDHENRARSDVR